MVAAAGVSTTRLGQKQRLFFGLDVPDDDPATIDSISSLVGGTPSVVSIFVKLDSVLPVDRLRQIAAAKQTAFLTLEPWLIASAPGDVNQPQFSLGSIIRGDHDADLRRLASAIGGLRQTVYLRFAHEMNAWWYPWAEAVNGNQPGQYVAAWRHVRKIFSPADRYVRWVWSPNEVLNVKRKLPTLSEVYPGDRWVHYVGMTGYSDGSASPTSTYQQTISQLTALSKHPVLLSEMGADGAAAPTWIRALPAYLAANPRIQGFVYFDTSPSTTGATGDYAITQSPQKTAAFRSLLRAIGANHKL